MGQGRDEEHHKPCNVKQEPNNFDVNTNGPKTPAEISRKFFNPRTYQPNPTTLPNKPNESFTTSTKSSIHPTHHPDPTQSTIKDDRHCPISDITNTPWSTKSLLVSCLNSFKSPTSSSTSSSSSSSRPSCSTHTKGATPVTPQEHPTSVLAAFWDKRWSRQLRMAGVEEITDVRVDYKDNCNTFFLGENFLATQHLTDGGMAKLLLGINRLSNEPIVVKQLPKTLVKANPGLFRLLLDEIKIHRTIDHPNVVKFVGAFESGKHVLHVLEFCNGGDFVEIVRQRGLLEEDEAKWLLFQVVEGLCCLHGQHIVHRDIKPENLLLHKPKGEEFHVVKIADFGHAVSLPEGLAVRNLAGTLSYSAPEVMAEQPHSYAVDVWSVGVVLYALLFGKLPWLNKGRHVKHALQVVRTTAIEFPSWTVVSNEAKQLILQLLKQNPADRPTMRQLREHPWFAPYRLKLRRPYQIPAPQPRMKKHVKKIVKQQTVSAPYYVEGAGNVDYNIRSNNIHHFAHHKNKSSMSHTTARNSKPTCSAMDRPVSSTVTKRWKNGRESRLLAETCVYGERRWSSYEFEQEFPALGVSYHSGAVVSPGSSPPLLSTPCSNSPRFSALDSDFSYSPVSSVFQSLTPRQMYAYPLPFTPLSGSLTSRCPPSHGFRGEAGLLPSPNMVGFNKGNCDYTQTSMVPFGIDTLPTRTSLQYRERSDPDCHPKPSIFPVYLPQNFGPSVLVGYRCRWSSEDSLLSPNLEVM